MASDEFTHDDANDEPLIVQPRPVLLTGLVATFAAFVLSMYFSQALMPVWLAAFGIGLLATAASIVLAPRSWVVLGSAAVVALLGRLIAQNAGWDSSTRLLFWILAVLAFFCALVVLLPSVLQRVVVSIVLLFHFGGILTAVSSAPPQPWVAGQLWTYVYRPYLQFMYLNNAYHFYSPEPGPATLLWFRIEYQPDPDGTKYSRWVKTPELDDNGKPIDRRPDGTVRHYPYVEFTRRLSLAESTNTMGVTAFNFEKLKQDRFIAGRARGIPIASDTDLALQYREPNAIGKQWVAAYARHVARSYPHEQKPEKEVIGVKVYRVTHLMVPQHQLKRLKDEKTGEVYSYGRRVDDPTLYVPVYFGEFDKDGKMKESCRKIVIESDGTWFEASRDPFLYWVIPIEREAKKPQPKDPYDYNSKNYMKIHAGDAEEVSQP